MNIFFPILQIIEDLRTKDECEIISENNWKLAEELKDMPPMSAHQIKEYVKSKSYGSKTKK